jgi:hypothetical protein
MNIEVNKRGTPQMKLERQAKAVLFKSTLQKWGMGKKDK